MKIYKYADAAEKSANEVFLFDLNISTHNYLRLGPLSFQWQFGGNCTQFQRRYGFVSV